MRTLNFRIPDGTPRQKLLSYTLRSYPEIPAYLLRGAFQKRDVKVDGIRCGKDTVTVCGSSVIVYIPENRDKAVPIIYQDDHLLIIHKPSGIPCETSRAGERTIADVLQGQLSLPSMPYPAHRLDAATEGLLMLAKDGESLSVLQDAFRNGLIHKEYLCLVKGILSPGEAVLRAFLTKDALHGRVSISDKPGSSSKEIITEYSLINSGEISCLRVTLHTGRTHQIRAHLSYIGHPVLGDDLYGDRAFNKAQHCRQLALCSAKLRFDTAFPLSRLNGAVFETTPHFFRS